MKKFLAFCNRPIEKLDENNVRRFLEYLIIEKKLAPRTVNQHSAAIRFFFAVGLNRHMNYLKIPLMKVPKDLPDVLTREEVGELIRVCVNAKHKAMLLLAYGSGLRSGEIETLRVKDIDSKEMRIFVKGGKNKRDRYTVLSQTTLEALRDYWRIYHPNSPEGWLSPVQAKAFRAIRACRTSALGAHVDTCDECGFEKISYNSCRNRHCPKCQTFIKEQWIEKQNQYLLNTGYFHVVFTLPEELNSIALRNQEIVYGLLFKSVPETLLELCADHKYLGATPGITTVLHTWGQNLMFHPHIHCIVTGGGLTKDGNWRGWQIRITSSTEETKGRA